MSIRVALEQLKQPGDIDYLLFMQTNLGADLINFRHSVLLTKACLRDSLKLNLQESHVGISVLEGLQVGPWLLRGIILKCVAILDILNLLPRRRYR